MLWKIRRALLFNVAAVVISMFLFQACSPVYYASNAHNVPLLREKDEIKITAGITGTEDLYGPDIQAAYAVTEKVGIIANGTYLMGGDDGSTWRGSGYLVEAAAGVYKPLGKDFVVEVYGGSGFARVTNQSHGEPFSLTFIKPFIQPAFGLSNKYIDVAFSPKIAWVHYSEPFILNYEIQTDANGNSIYSNIKEKQTFFAFEPGLTIRGGWKFAKLQLQLIRSFQDIPNTQPVTINLSLALDLAPRFRKIPE